MFWVQSREFFRRFYTTAQQSVFAVRTKSLRNTNNGGVGDESSFVSLKVNVGFVFCLRALMEEWWLGSACDLLPYILCFHVTE